ncbi:hypothetical protein ABC855_g1884 [[Candida] zeylanoides]
MDWVGQQERAFTRWINARTGAHVEDLRTDLSDGLVLVRLVNHLVQDGRGGGGALLEPVYARPTLRLQKLANVADVLEYARLGLRIPNLGGVSAENIVDGDIKYVLGLVWAILEYSTMTTQCLYNESTSFLEVERVLKRWVNLIIAKRGLPAVSNFGRDWSLEVGRPDLIFACILEHYLGPSSAVSFGEMQDGKRLQNLQRVFDAAQVLGIAPMAAVEDFRQLVPDEKCVVICLIEWMKVLELDEPPGQPEPQATPPEPWATSSEPRATASREACGGGAAELPDAAGGSCEPAGDYHSFGESIDLGCSFGESTDHGRSSGKPSNAAGSFGKPSDAAGSFGESSDAAGGSGESSDGSSGESSDVAGGSVNPASPSRGSEPASPLAGDPDRASPASSPETIVPSEPDTGSARDASDGGAFVAPTRLIAAITPPFASIDPLLASIRGCFALAAAPAAAIDAAFAAPTARLSELQDGLVQFDCFRASFRGRASPQLVALTEHFSVTASMAVCMLASECELEEAACGASPSAPAAPSEARFRHHVEALCTRVETLKDYFENLEVSAFVSQMRAAPPLASAASPPPPKHLTPSYSDFSIHLSDASATSSLFE